MKLYSFLYHRTDPRNTAFTKYIENMFLTLTRQVVGTSEFRIARSLCCSWLRNEAYHAECFSFDNLAACKNRDKLLIEVMEGCRNWHRILSPRLVARWRSFYTQMSYFKRLKQVELLGSLSSGSRFLIVKNPLITLPIVSPVEKFESLRMAETTLRKPSSILPVSSSSPTSTHRMENCGSMCAKPRSGGLETSKIKLYYEWRDCHRHEYE